MIRFEGVNQKIFLCIIVALVQVNFCSSQNRVSGNVFTAKDSTAIYGGTVYFDGTSMGVYTDEEGFFQMLFKKNNSLLIISSIGYESVVVDLQDIQSNNILPNIYLSEKLEKLETVYIEVDKLNRSRKLAIFKREFLGARLCKIVNENSN
jgi:hypothetical protein